ncbi:MAG: LAGLIDADG family homing endonuclease [Candidatus Nanoarchaeia archaeon]|nr:LAGLIDADG family homing endonuclease [Candidatus Nanoarchaeia archaeon]
MKITPELARIHSHICGDGCAYLRNGKRNLTSLKKHPRINLNYPHWIIEYCNTCEELIKEFIEDMKISYNRNCNYIYRSRVRYAGVLHIVDELELKGKNSRSWYIPKFIMNASEKVIVNWLRAFFDDEATVAIRSIRIKCMNKNGLIQVSKLLFKLNIYSKITGINIDGSWYLNVYKEDLQKYENKIGFLHPSKKNKLNILVKERFKK